MSILIGNGVNQTVVSEREYKKTSRSSKRAASQIDKRINECFQYNLQSALCLKIEFLVFNYSVIVRYSETNTRPFDLA
jgi:hypothetical protein